MKDIYTQLNEALAKLKEASPSKHGEVTTKITTINSSEAKLHCVNEAIAEVVKESNPLGLEDISEAKRDFPMLFGVEPRAAVTTKESKHINHHNGAVDNGHAPITESGKRHDLFEKGDKVLIEAEFKRGKITAEQRSCLVRSLPHTQA